VIVTSALDIKGGWGNGVLDDLLGNRDGLA